MNGNFLASGMVVIFVTYELHSPHVAHILRDNNKSFYSIVSIVAFEPYTKRYIGIYKIYNVNIYKIYKR